MRLETMMKTLTIAALITGLALSAGASALAADPAEAPAAAPGKRACFFSHQITGWRDARPRNDRVVYLDVSPHDVYRLDTFGPCPGIESALSIGVETTGASSVICEGLDVVLIVQGPTGPDRCHVSKITRLTPDEVKAAFPKRRH